MGKPPNRERKYSPSENKWVAQKCENGAALDKRQTTEKYKLGGNDFYLFHG